MQSYESIQLESGTHDIGPYLSETNGRLISILLLYLLYLLLRDHKDRKI